jgi:hypothetical protein
MYTISHDYMTISPNVNIVFTIVYKHGIVVNAICYYVFHDCSQGYNLFFLT